MQLCNNDSMKLKIFGLILWPFFLFILSIATHEMSHYFTLQATGGDGNIQFKGLTYGFVIATSPPDTMPYLFLFAGGLVTALIFGALWAWVRLTPTHWDLPQEVGLAIAALWNLQYGTLEGIGYWNREVFVDYRDLTIVSTAMIVTAVYCRTLISWGGEKWDSEKSDLPRV